jgi:hypothetical protein
LSEIIFTRNSGIEAGAGMPMVSLPPFCVRTHFTYSSMVLAGVPPETASTLAKVAKPATGTKSVAGLKPGS